MSSGHTHTYIHKHKLQCFQSDPCIILIFWIPLFFLMYKSCVVVIYDVKISDLRDPGERLCVWLRLSTFLESSNTKFTFLTTRSEISSRSDGGAGGLVFSLSLFVSADSFMWSGCFSDDCRAGIQCIWQLYWVNTVICLAPAKHTPDLLPSSATVLSVCVCVCLEKVSL